MDHKTLYKAYETQATIVNKTESKEDPKDSTEKQRESLPSAKRGREG
jgi:hypothetical protein